MSQLRHLNRTPRWMDWMCLGIFTHCKVREHPTHGHWTASCCWCLRPCIRRCSLMDLTEPSSRRAQCKPPASPQVGAGTAGKPSIATSCAGTSCDALFSSGDSCTLPDGGVNGTALMNPSPYWFQLVPRLVEEWTGTSKYQTPKWESLRRSARDLRDLPRKQNLCSMVCQG